MTVESRGERFLPPTSEDPRNPFERDRDRVLYSPEFRRLSGVTQVSSASEGDIFHNRLTHSLKVAQVGRRLAEHLLAETPTERIEAWGGLDPDVVETAGLAHDLGHPPFGHDGEDVICRAMDELGQRDGFEGNAQSFRIVTRLAAHSDNIPIIDDVRGPDSNTGLNLTRASLNAILKYPWTRSDCKDGSTKWGVYDSDKERFKWARRGYQGKYLALEAELMNWADDVTYAVHDLEDFYRAGLIPIHRLLHTTESERFTEAVRKNSNSLAKQGDLEEVLLSILGTMYLLDEPYNGGTQQRTIMHGATSALITQYIIGDAIRISEPNTERSITIHPKMRLQVDLLKEVTRYYVIDHPRVVSIREGQKEMLRKLFEIYTEVLAGTRKQTMLPRATRDRLDSGDRSPRLVADLLAGMTERQVIQNYQRLTGILPWPMSHFDL